MSKTLFIADLHLNRQQPAITAGFLHFLHEEAITADALYILGDLFETWIGDDDPDPLHETVSKALHHLQQHGVRCYFIHGNRDFLLGKAFAQKSGLQLLSQETVLDLYGTKTLILHGDTLCTDDLHYQRFRRYVHNKGIQWLFLHLPLRLRLHFANQLRQRSQSSNQKKTDMLMDVNQYTVIQRLQRHGANRMIHGHTHRPAIHTLTHYPAQRIVLGAWHEHGSVLCVSETCCELIDISFQSVKQA